MDYRTLPPWVVVKFGGTSVSCPASWESIASIVRASHNAGNRVVIVCSAIARVTDSLVGLADEVERGGRVAARLAEIRRIHDDLADQLGLDGQGILDASYRRLERIVDEVEGESAGGAWSSRARARRRAEIIASGELLSTTLGAHRLRRCGLPARWIDARTLLTASEASESGSDTQHYLSAKCSYEPDPELVATLAQAGGEIFVTQGFLASDSEGDTVLLGRGGSDTSAAYLAAKLAASRLEIWTDVPGVFSGDPRLFGDARLIKRMTFAEAQAMSAMGGRVLHPRCLEPARDHGIAVRIGWTRYPESPGTLIDDEAMGEVGVKTVLSRRNLALLIMTRQARWQPVGFMAEVATRFQRHGLSIDLISSSPGEIRATIDLAAFPRSDEAIAALMDDLSDICLPSIDRDVACVSVTGSSTRSAVHKLDDTLHSLSDPDVHLVSYAADDSHVSFVVSTHRTAELLEQLHEALFDHVTESPVFGPRYEDLVKMAETGNRRARGKTGDASSLAAG